MKKHRSFWQRICHWEVWLEQLDATVWDADHIEAVLRQYAQDKGIKPRDYFPFIRAVISGKSVGPSLFHLMEAMPKTWF